MEEIHSIPDQLAYVTIRIECKDTNSKSSYGTGFFFLFNTTDKYCCPAIITNHHVLKDAETIFIYFTLTDSNGMPQVGKMQGIVFPNIKKYMIIHPDPNVDLAALFIGELLHQLLEQEKHVFYKAIDASMIPSSKRLATLSALEEIVMIGYPIGIWDNVNNMPIFRKGITATHPRYDYQGRKEFLVDAPCFPGSSGSPVFCYKERLKIKAGHGIKINGGEPQLEFLGILYAGPQMTITGEIITVEIPMQQIQISNSRIPVNLGCVIKAERILEIEPLIKEKFGNQTPIPL